MKDDLLATLLRLSGKYPALRLCQLIGNAIPTEESVRRNNDLYYVEDGQLLQWLKEYEVKADSARARG